MLCYLRLSLLFFLSLPSYILTQSIEIEEIVVTATKRDATSAQDVGISLSAISEETLERNGFDSFSDYASSVAGLSFGERGPGQSLIILRGINSSSTQFNTDEPESKETVGIYFDETPVSLNGFHPSPRLFDIQRIEVLRGPQGTLYGSGSLSGTIRYISNSPDPSTFSSKFRTTYSNTHLGGNNYDINGMINSPLIEGTSALRFTGYGRFIDGFIDNKAPQIDPRHPLFGQSPFHSLEAFNDVNTDNTWGMRVQYSYEPNDRFKAIARIYYQKSDFGGYPTEDTFTESEPLPGNDPNNANLDELQQNRLLAEPSSDQFSLYNLDMHFDLGFAKLVTVTSFLQRNLVQDFEFSDFIPDLLGDFMILNVSPIDFPVPSILNNVTDVEDVIQEVRLVSKSDHNISWVLGGFFDSQDKQFLQSAPTFGLTEALASFELPSLATLFEAPAPGLPDNVFESRSTFDEHQIAVFGEIAWDINERWRLIGGARWFDFDQDFFFGDTQGAFATGLSINNNLSENGINPKLSIEYRPKEDRLVYLSSSRGFRLGGNNDPILLELCQVTSADLTFKSDSLWSFELGGKTRVNERLQLNGAAYYINWSDIPATETLPCGTAITRNVSEATVYGFETDLTYAATERLQVGGNLGYTNSTFSNTFLPLNIVDGTETPLIPQWTFNVNAIYTFPLKIGNWDDLSGYISGNYSFQDERFNTANPMERVAMDAYSLANLRLGIQNDRWQASLFANNVFDERALIFKDTIFLAENRDTLNRPRTLGVTLIAHY